ncbi:PDDEXK nuclease domain-containing protein [Bdellovibrionota bacterium FG-1]
MPITKANTALYSNVRSILDQARGKVHKTINSIMVQAYWHVGRLIIEEEQRGKNRANYGEYLLEFLSKKLSKDFGKGFSITNLKNMRLFYRAFPKRQTVSDQLSWSHYLILTRIEDPQMRSFYLKETINASWSVRELERQAASLLYERLALSKNKKARTRLAQKGHEITSPADLVKDPYVLEFLGIKPAALMYEKELETALIDHLQEFLLELGKGFTFVGRQQRLTIEGDHFFVDLVFYNRVAKCFVLIDLKLGKLTHQDIGQMQMYLNYFKRTERLAGENEPIGILLCSEKNDTVVKFTLPEGKREIFASKYKLTLPTEVELKKEIIKERKLLDTKKH